METYKYDVFISYHERDRDWIKGQMLQRLKARGVNYIDHRHFVPGRARLNEIERAIEDSRKIWLILTNSFLTDEFQTFQDNLALYRALRDGSYRAVPVIKEPCVLPSRLQVLVSVEFGNAEDEHEDAWERLFATVQPSADPPGRVARDGVYALRELIRKSGKAREAVGRFGQNFHTACTEIASLDDYKRLHDLLQRLERECQILSLGARQTQMDADLSRGLNLTLAELKLLLDKFESVWRRGFSLVPDDEPAWVGKLKRTYTLMWAAVEPWTPAAFKRAVDDFDSALARGLSETDTCLREVIRRLRQAAFLEALQAIHEQMADLARQDSTRDQFAEFSRGLAALAELNQRLSKLLGLHNLLQEIYDELRGVLGQGSDSAAIRDAWSYTISRKMNALRPLCEGERSDHLFEVGAALGAAIEMNNQPAIKQAFFGLYRQISNDFNEVDPDLMKQCEALRQVGGPVACLLTEVNDD